MKFIAYYRVSTAKQGLSGLGLESQRSIVSRYVGDKGIIISEFTDVESGKNDARPQLQQALAAVKVQQAKLVIAKLDRLSRNLTFISMMMDAGVSFVCCDMPAANEFTLHIFAALAQQERKLISQRTRDALAAKRARGEKIGNPTIFSLAGRRKGNQSRHLKALQDRNNQYLVAFARLLRDKGMTYRQVTSELNRLGMKGAQGGDLNPGSVFRLLKMMP